MAKGHISALVVVAAVVGLAACGGSGNSGAGGRAAPPIGDAAIQSADVVAHAGTFSQPLDAAPSPDGTVIYFVATGDHGPAVLSVPAGGGATTTVAQGASLAKPTGVAVSTDGSRIFVADPAAASGALLTAPTTGAPATPTALPGTQGRNPHGLDVVNQSGGDVVYFTGTDPANGAPGLFRVPSAGGTVATVAEGAPFSSPDSVVVAASGVAYVSDQGAGSAKGQVLRVSGGRVTPVVSGVHLGAPAGVTLTHGDSTLLVSSIDATTHSDQVLFVDLATGKTAAATKVIGANKDSAGGLHRAHNALGLAWADIRGRVYRVCLASAAANSRALPSGGKTANLIALITQEKTEAC